MLKEEKKGRLEVQKSCETARRNFTDEFSLSWGRNRVAQISLDCDVEVRFKISYENQLRNMSTYIYINTRHPIGEMDGRNKSAILTPQVQ